MPVHLGGRDQQSALEQRLVAQRVDLDQAVLEHLVCRRVGTSDTRRLILLEHADREIERPRVDSREQDAELAPISRLRQGDVSNVILEIKIRIIDEIRTVEVDGS